MNRRRVPGLLLAAVILVGCGDDGGTTEPTPEATAYAAELNAAQVELADGIQSEIEGRAPATNQEFAQWTETFAAAYRDFSARLRAITPPEDVAMLHDQLLETVDRIQANLDRATADLRDSESDRAPNLSAVFKNAAIADLEEILIEMNATLGLAEPPVPGVPVAPPDDPPTTPSP
jgi:hypothetical protein